MAPPKSKEQQVETRFLPATEKYFLGWHQVEILPVDQSADVAWWLLSKVAPGLEEAF
jgi:hypothetical protein